MRNQWLIALSLLPLTAIAPAQDFNLPLETGPSPAPPLLPDLQPERPAGAEINAAARADEPLWIGHLSGTDEIPLGPDGMEALRGALERDPALQAALREAGRGQIRVIGTDDHEDLRLRMDSSVLDLVFAPTLIYLRQRGNYQVAGQIQSPDIVGTTGATGLSKSAVIFVNRTHPLFTGESPPAEQLLTRPMGVVSASSATGYVFPLLTYQQTHGLTEPPRLVFLQTAEDVVLAVLNNLVSIGACDQNTFDRVLFEQGQGADLSNLIRAVETTAPIPVAPVVIRRELAGTAVGDALINALDRFLENRGEVPLDLERAVDERPYQRLARQVESFYEARAPR